MVHEDDSEEFRSASVGPVHTNSSDTRLTITELSPYTVYAFVVQVKRSSSFSNTVDRIFKIKFLGCE